MKPKLRMPAFMREVKALTLETALKAAEEIGYPLSVRPAYKYGGRGGMRIVYNDQDLGSFMRAAAKEEGIANQELQSRLLETLEKHWNEKYSEIDPSLLKNIQKSCI